MSLTSTLRLKGTASAADIVVAIMGTDEIQVFEYMKSCPNVFVSAIEIARRVGGKRRLREDPDWIRPVLLRMVSDELLEADHFGQYRLKMRAKNRPHPQKLTMDNFETWELVLEEQPENFGSVNDLPAQS